MHFIVFDVKCSKEREQPWIVRVSAETRDPMNSVNWKDSLTIAHKRAETHGLIKKSVPFQAIFHAANSFNMLKLN